MFIPFNSMGSVLLTSLLVLLLVALLLLSRRFYSLS